MGTGRKRDNRKAGSEKKTCQLECVPERSSNFLFTKEALFRKTVTHADRGLGKGGAWKKEEKAKAKNIRIAQKVPSLGRLVTRG